MRAAWLSVTALSLILCSSAACAGDLLLVPNDNGCQALGAAGGALPVVANPAPEPEDNNWACIDGPKGMLCLALNRTDEIQQKGLLQRSGRANDDLPFVALALHQTPLADTYKVFPHGTVSLESTRETLILLPGDSESKPYLLRIEAFVAFGDGRYGHMVKLCTGAAAPMSREVAVNVHKAMSIAVPSPGSQTGRRHKK